MADTSEGIGKMLTEFTDSSNIDKVVEWGLWCHIKVAEGVSVDKVFDDLQKFQGVQFYKKDELPDRFHFKHHALIYDIIMVANAKDKIQLAADLSHPNQYQPKASVFKGMLFTFFITCHLF